MMAGSPGLWWLAAAAMFAIAEMLVPGTFLIFLAAAAAFTGLATLALADLPIEGQLASFAIWSAVTVLVGRRWYRDYPVETSDPALNNRIARLIGEVVEVTDPIAGGHGRVRVGDGTWPALGPDAPSGARVRITGLVDGRLTVEPIDQLS
jgi:membrane protein implicated in regulation of membrane protease activity